MFSTFRMCFHLLILSFIHFKLHSLDVPSVFDVMQYIDERQRTNIPYKNGYKNDQTIKLILKKGIQ